MDELKKLSQHLNYVLSYTIIGQNGEVVEQRELVQKIDGFNIEIYPNEHLPPHFHVKGPDINVSISIDTCEILKGTLKRSTKKKVEYFHSMHKARLVEVWNKLRPSDYERNKI